MSLNTMNIRSRLSSKNNDVSIPRTFCWSRMGTEAGEHLSSIVRRKELERRACGGMFFWGVGNPMGAGLAALRGHAPEPTVVFSAMKSKPASADETPSGLLLWLSYIDGCDRETELPACSLVTSRSVTVGGRPKEVHYALVCSTQATICTEPVGDLDAGQLVNVLSGRPVGSTQITAAVSLTPKRRPNPSTYQINFVAKLSGPGQVRLARYAPITSTDLIHAWEAAERGSLRGWRSAVTALKADVDRRARYPQSLSRQLQQATLELIAAE
jgi:hypothetical protein